MLKQAIRKPLSNLNQVLQGLNSADQNDLINFLTKSTKTAEKCNLPSDRVHRDLPQLKLVTGCDLETNEPWGRNESTAEQQVQQLLHHVGRQQHELEQYELDLQRRQANLQHASEQWQRERMQQAAEIDHRQTALRHQQQQIQQQQAQLVKLQQGLVDTQTSLRRVIEKIVENCDADGLKQEIQELRFELNESFERNFNRWESLCRSLSATTQHLP